MDGDDNGRFLSHKRLSFSLYSMTLSVCFCSQLLLSGSCLLVQACVNIQFKSNCRQVHLL